MQTSRTACISASATRQPARALPCRNKGVAVARRGVVQLRATPDKSSAEEQAARTTSSKPVVSNTTSESTPFPFLRVAAATASVALLLGGSYELNLAARASADDKPVAAAPSSSKPAPPAYNTAVHQSVRLAVATAFQDAGSNTKVTRESVARAVEVAVAQVMQEVVNEAVAKDTGIPSIARKPAQPMAEIASVPSKPAPSVKADAPSVAEPKSENKTVAAIDDARLALVKALDAVRTDALQKTAPKVETPKVEAAPSNPAALIAEASDKSSDKPAPPASTDDKMSPSSSSSDPVMLLASKPDPDKPVVAEADTKDIQVVVAAPAVNQTETSEVAAMTPKEAEDLVRKSATAVAQEVALDVMREVAKAEAKADAKTDGKASRDEVALTAESPSSGPSSGASSKADGGVVVEPITISTDGGKKSMTFTITITVDMAK